MKPGVRQNGDRLLKLIQGWPYCNLPSFSVVAKFVPKQLDLPVTVYSDLVQKDVRQIHESGVKRLVGLRMVLRMPEALWGGRELFDGFFGNALT
jgi:hypothetical protein